MRRSPFVLLLTSLVAFLAALGVNVPQARPADAPVEPLVEKVRRSIKDGAAYLKGKQNNGRWVYFHAHPGQPNGDGGTALVLLALLTSGEPITERPVREGLDYLRTVEPKATYTVALQTMVFAMVGDPKDRDLIKRNVEWLQKAHSAKGWGYQSGAGTWDNSNTQYALLGLHEALQAGVAVDPAVLAQMRQLFIDTQNDTGGWGYEPQMNSPFRFTMTTAGLCNLIITGMDLDMGKQILTADGSAKNCGVYAEDVPVSRAMRRITAEMNAGLQGAIKIYPYYALYGLERAGRLTGQRYIGEHDWYREGCLYLLDRQNKDGSWEDPSARGLGGDPVIATSFALLFLSKGRTPVLISKLAYGDQKSDDWNRKRSDVRHLADFCSKELFKRQPMAWQNFDVRKKEAANREEIRDLAAELLQSPIVFFNGHNFAPRDKEEEILREYVNNGGFILAEACCGAPGFDRDFRKLCDRLFGEDSLKPLPPNHPVWTASGKFESDPKAFELWGVSQGCKTVLIYSPKPIAGYWESNDLKTPRSKAVFELGANIVAYATGLAPPKPRLTEMTVARDGPVQKTKRGFFRVAQLEPRTEAAPAPRAMRNLMEETRKAGIDVVLKTETYNPADERIKGFWFFYMHGRESFQYSDADLKMLRFRLEHGGTLLADACCGAKPFDESFRRLMEQMWRDAPADARPKLEPIPTNDELFSRDLNGEAIDTVRCRRPGPDGKRGSPELQTVPPALEGVKINGRWAVIYSKYDLGCALEKGTSPDCIGHDYDSAVKLARAAVLYSLKR